MNRYFGLLLACILILPSYLRADDNDFVVDEDMALMDVVIEPTVVEPIHVSVDIQPMVPVVQSSVAVKPVYVVDPATPVQVLVKAIFAVDFANKTEVEIKAVVAQMMAEKTDIQVRQITSAVLSQPNKIAVARVLSAMIAVATEVHLQNIVKAVVAESNVEFNVSDIFSAVFAKITEVQTQTITEVILAELISMEVSSNNSAEEAVATRVRADAILKQAIVAMSDMSVSSILKAAMQKGNPVSVNAILEAVAATKTKVQVKRIVAAAYAEVYHRDLFDVIDDGEFFYIVRELRMAQKNGDVEREAKLKNAIMLVLLNAEEPTPFKEEDVR